MGLAILLLLVPVICPALFLYSGCGHRRDQRQPADRRAALSTRESETGKWALTTVVFASLVAALGLALANPYLALAGIAGVAVGAGAIVWLTQLAIDHGPGRR